MVAQVDDQGNVQQYAYIMSEQTKDDYMEQDLDYANVFGAMAGQTVDKAVSPGLNAELVSRLKVMFDMEASETPENYVEISPYTHDPDMRQIYYQMPDKMRKEIEAVWGSKRMYVAKDVLAIAFGYRKYNITRAFLKTAEERRLAERFIVKFFNSFAETNEIAMKRASTTEDVFKELAHMAKDNIIVKTFFVSLMNFGSNLMYLRTLRVPISYILKHSTVALVEGLKYQAHAKELGELKIKLNNLRQTPGHNQAEAKEIEYKINRLEDKIHKNPTTRFIEAGGMPTVVDDIDTDVTQSDYPGRLERTFAPLKPFIDKLGVTYKDKEYNVGKILFMTADTQGYKLMNNSVKLTDYIARYVLHEHYTKTQGMDHKKAMESVIDEFVNFSLPTHRMVEYLNEVGLLWFTKFGLRILKPIKNAAVDKPFDFLLTFLASEHMGFDNIANSIPLVTNNPLNKIGNPFSNFLGSLDEILSINMILNWFKK
jgi:hypothetical protein